MLNKTAVVSSNIASVGWENDVLEVTFHNSGTYRAEGVPKSVYDALVSAKSVGKYFNASVKNAYELKKVS
jgi:hypothetical protein